MYLCKVLSLCQGQLVVQHPDAHMIVDGSQSFALVLGTAKAVHYSIEGFQGVIQGLASAGIAAKIVGSWLSASATIFSSPFIYLRLGEYSLIKSLQSSMTRSKLKFF
jgi:hypothetical protein